MRNLILIFLLIFSFSTTFFAQTGCPGCIVNLPEGMPMDTLFLGDAADGQVNVAYDSDLSFRLPITTTTVAETDPSIPAGLGINKIIIEGVSNLPPGLSWEASQTTFDPSEMNDGCVIDVSFISLEKIFPFIHSFLKPGAFVIALVKPQFEVGKNNVGKGGIVKDKKLYPIVIENIKRLGNLNNLTFIDLADSPILGGDGNKEFLIYFKKN